MKNLPSDISILEMNIITFIGKNIKVSMKQIINNLPKSETCIKIHVKRLVDKGYIIKCGKGRETWYQWPF